MLAIIGILVIFAGVLGGFIMHRGNLGTLVQPSEFLIIGGAALGAMLAMSPRHVLKGMVTALVQLIKDKPNSSARSLRMLVTVFRLLRVASYDGGNALEPHVERPHESHIMQDNPEFLHDHEALEFFCDTVKVIILGGVPEHQISELTDLSLSTHEAEAQEPVTVMTKVADSLPGLGIVAAVLGIIVTMQSIDGKPEEVGHNVAVALVGTFLGVFLCYGLMGPLASKMEFLNHQAHLRLKSLQACLLAFARGLHPLVCVEFGRRVLPSHVRPTFNELEESCREEGRNRQGQAA